jgi:hypothetical protein
MPDMMKQPPVDLSMINGRPLSVKELDALIGMEKGAIEDMAMKQDEGLPMRSPQGKFSKGGFSPLVDALNIALPLFSAAPVSKPSEPSMTIPDDVLKPFLMVVSAINDAVDQSVLDSSMQIVIGDIIEDAGLKMAAAKIAKASKDIGFKKWLKEAPSSEETGREVSEESEAEAPEVAVNVGVSPAPMPGMPMSDAQMEALFAQRA